jgi:nucleotide-binding universal stress UspA family protein
LKPRRSGLSLRAAAVLSAPPGIPKAMGSAGRQRWEPTQLRLSIPAAAGAGNETGGRVFSKILVCLDGSERAEQVLPSVKEIARRFGSKVVLLQVFDITALIQMPAQLLFKPYWAGQLRREEDGARDYLERMRKRLEEEGVEAETATFQALPDEIIVRYAADSGVDLIAMTTYGRRRRGGAVLGSVAEHVLRRSSLPVLTVRPEETKT